MIARIKNTMVNENKDSWPVGLDNLTNGNYNQLLAAFYQAALDNHLPVALWRYPDHSEKQALVDFGDTARPIKIDFTQKTPGFAFAPFINEGGQSTLFIKAGLHLDEAGHHFYPNGRGEHNASETNNKARFLITYQQLALGSGKPKRRWEIGPQCTGNSICTEAEFCTLVKEAIDYIESTDIKKIVVSRATETPLPPNFNPVAIFEALCRRYRHGFISLVSIPTIGTWIGASPELLLSLKNEALCTVALAGTQPRPFETPLPETSWGAKEVEEQALVSDYIRAFFQELGLKNFTEDGPHTVSAGSIVHLQTKFEMQLDHPRLRHLANQILDNLHPTSAVCGMPKKEALSFILEKENYNRAFYSGFLGPIHLNRQSHLFVNLRCMQLKQNSALLYTGAGITPNSGPQAEWVETVLKSKTLLSILRPELVQAIQS